MTTTDRRAGAPDGRAARAQVVHTSVLWGLGALLAGAAAAVITTEQARPPSAAAWAAPAAPGPGLVASHPGRRVVVVRRSRAS